MMRSKTLAAMTLVAGMVACGGGGGGPGGKGALNPKDRSGKKDTTGSHVSTKAAAAFDRALDEFAGHDKKGDWNESTCTAVAQQFLDANKAQQSDAGKPLPEALY